MRWCLLLGVACRHAQATDCGTTHTQHEVECMEGVSAGDGGAPPPKGFQVVGQGRGGDPALTCFSCRCGPRATWPGPIQAKRHLQGSTAAGTKAACFRAGALKFKFSDDRPAG